MKISEIHNTAQTLVCHGHRHLISFPYLVAELLSSPPPRFGSRYELLLLAISSRLAIELIRLCFNWVLGSSSSACSLDNIPVADNST